MEVKTPPPLLTRDRLEKYRRDLRTALTFYRIEGATLHLTATERRALLSDVKKAAIKFIERPSKQSADKLLGLLDGLNVNTAVLIERLVVQCGQPKTAVVALKRELRGLFSLVPEDGQAAVDIWPVAMRDGLLAAEPGGATTVPPRAAEAFKVNEKDRAWVDAQCTPQSIRCFLQKLTLSGARERIAKKSYIRATGVAIPYFDAGLASARRKGWRTYEVPCGHDVMLDMPERLTEILQEAA